MASKQLGRLRQWAGEVISSKEKTAVNDEFKDLEKDIELRKEGIQRLIAASGTYHHAISKKKASPTQDEGEKMLPVDILGVTMIIHGEQFGEDSNFGTSLVKFGRANCKIAALQEAFAVTFKDTFMATLERFKEEIKEYEVIKKKLETRRVACDSATAKFEKLQTSKKEKDRREAEDEMERAKQRYDEIAEDLRAHVHAVQENEIYQHRELTAFLDLETNYVQSYLDVLKDVKKDWPERSEAKTFKHLEKENHFRLPIKPQRTDSSPSDSSDDDGGPPTPGRTPKHSRRGSNASRNGTPSRPSSRLSRKRANSSAVGRVSLDEERANEREKEKPKEKEREKEKDGERSRRMSVAGWASSAVESVTGSKSKKSKDKDSFATLEDDVPPRKSFETEGERSIRKSSSFRGLSRKSSKSKSKENLPVNPSLGLGPPSKTKTTTKILKPPSLQDRKVVRALYDFSGSSDELSFKAGSDIVVVQEVLDDWWMGEVDGQRGLFPTSYTEVLANGKPQPPHRTNKLNPIYPPAVNGHAHGSIDHDSDLDVDHDHDPDHYMTSDADEEQIIRAVPMAINRSPIFFGRFDDKASFTSSMVDDADDEGFKAADAVGGAVGGRTLPINIRFPGDEGDNNWLPPSNSAAARGQRAHTPSLTPPSTQNVQAKRSVLRSTDPAQQPLINRAMSDNPPTSVGVTVGGGSKKVPPPPPPRRAASHNPATSLAPPPIPERRAPQPSSSSLFTSSSVSSSVTNLSASASQPSSLSSSFSGKGYLGTGMGYDRSPFESAVELELEIGGDGEGGGGGARSCEQFRQNPFKPKGMCSNCLEFHD